MVRRVNVIENRIPVLDIVWIPLWLICVIGGADRIGPLLRIMYLDHISGQYRRCVSRLRFNPALRVGSLCRVPFIITGHCGARRRLRGRVRRGALSSSGELLIGEGSCIAERPGLVPRNQIRPRGGSVDMTRICGCSSRWRWEVSSVHGGQQQVGTASQLRWCSVLGTRG